TINVDRQNAPFGGNTLSLNATIGTNTLTVTGGNGYGLGVAATFTGNTSLNPTTAPLTLNTGTSGTGSYTMVGVAPLNIGGVDAHTGSSTLNTGTTTITGTGSVTDSNISINSGAALTLFKAPVGISDSVVNGTVTLNGGTLNVTQTTSSVQTESLKLTLASGLSTMNLTPFGTGDIQLTASTYTRNPGGALIFNRGGVSPNDSNFFIPGTAASTPFPYITVNEPAASGPGKYDATLGVIATAGNVYTSLKSGDWDD